MQLTGDDAVHNQATARIESILPTDPRTGAVPFDTLVVYLKVVVAMAERSAQPLSVIRFVVDGGPSPYRFGQAGALLIGRAVVRCLYQETRPYDVVGCGPERSPDGIPEFLVICPLIGEAEATQFAERIRGTISSRTAISPDSWITLSVGVAGMGIGMEGADLLLERAAYSRAAAERAGGDQTRRYSEFGHLAC